LTNRIGSTPRISIYGQRRRRGPPRIVGVALFVAILAVTATVTRTLVASTQSSPPDPSAPGGGLAAAVTSPSPVAATPPESTPSPIASPSPATPPSVTPLPVPSPAATLTPVRVAVALDVDPRPNAVFKTEVLNTWCAAAAVQMTLNVIGPSIDITTARQQRIHVLEVANTTRADSRSGGVGPLGMAATLTQLGTVRYELRVYRTRAVALRDAARAISVTRHPVILLAWFGAHAWVMTGFRADADPRYFANANVLGADVLDAWYPRVSSIWGPSDPPGTYQNAAEMVRNYLPWKRPEAHYPGWDGRFLALVPAAAPSG